MLWASFEGVRWGHICASTHPEHPWGDTGCFSPFLSAAFLNVSGWIRVLNGTPREALNIESQSQARAPTGWEESMGGSRSACVNRMSFPNMIQTPAQRQEKESKASPSITSNTAIFRAHTTSLALGSKGPAVQGDEAGLIESVKSGDLAGVCVCICVCRKKRTGGQAAFFPKCTPEPGFSCEHEGETEQEVILGGELSREKKGPRLSQNCLPPRPAPWRSDLPFHMCTGLSYPLPNPGRGQSSLSPRLDRMLAACWCPWLCYHSLENIWPT